MRVSWRVLVAGVVVTVMMVTAGAPAAGSVGAVSDAIGAASVTWSAPVDVRSGSGASATDTGGCLAITAGVGSIACAVAGGAVAGAVTSLWKTQVTKTEKFSWGGLATSVGMGVVSGFVGGAAGPVLRSVAQSVVSAGAGAATVSAVRAGVQSVLSKTAGVVSTIGQRVGTGFKSVLGGSKSAGRLGSSNVARTAGESVDNMPTVWPSNNGFYGNLGPHGNPGVTVLKPGAQVDRFGFDGGRFASPTGSPVAQRALAPGAADKPYSVFEVTRRLVVQRGPAKPWFGQPGMGIQYYLPASIDDLLKTGYLRRLG